MDAVHWYNHNLPDLAKRIYGSSYRIAELFGKK
ncbi:hypothetical protein CLV58_11886 [Spirosoma oryzae]|uniref:Uncharacterized protein n=1 Tax=Spirosoma oryzae TaxID=1469603 RepID=A0A2T0SLC8_9BACT|nr:hypothetical protein CLV58_11886 [Spirosoma oryzae]